MTTEETEATQMCRFGLDDGTDTVLGGGDISRRRSGRLRQAVKRDKLDWSPRTPYPK